MKSNKILAILIIVIGLGGSVYMLYLTFRTVGKPADRSVGNESFLPGVSLVQLEDGGDGSILPFGTKFETEKINKYNPTKKLYPYSIVNKNEIGKGLDVIY